MKVVVVFLSLLGICYGSSKQWQRDVNFDNPNNWNTGKAPCATNKIIFPETVKGVLLQTNMTSVKEVVLPKDGVLLMPSNMTLNFSDSPASDPECDGGDITFTRTNDESWFDPDNWLDSDSLITVESERVPCTYDSVIFPQDKVFNVKLDSSITVGTMTFSGKDYSTSRFSSFLASETGKMQFSITSGASVTIKGNSCPITSGCPCGNDNEVLLPKICNLYSCLAVSCRNAVTPVGGCCPLCGAILTMEYTTNFNLANFKKKIHDDFGVRDNPADNPTGGRRRREVDTGMVDTYTSKTSKDQIQLVLTDRAAGSSSGQTAIDMAQKIVTAMQNDPGAFGITSVDMKSSQKGTGTQTGGLSGGGVVGIVIAVLVVVIVIITVIFLLRRYQYTPFFSKDQPLHADMEIAADIPVGFMETIPGQPAAMYMQSFDNPVYNTPSAEDNLYDDPTKVATMDLTEVDSNDLKKETKKGKGLPPETLTASFDNPNYASVMETGIDDVTSEGGARAEDLSKMESES
ncbi:protein amnionless-like [Acanthaster planci]|uniref:Protein amnionless n=1 Tax=Acanthaster planci TaxID=133434 RepID=A0A8B7XND3_ACAPL|nr:protein amnionless-like [Acanthaster planci]